MSGNQVIKVAQTLASAPSEARLGEFVIRDVRCFAGENRVPIRPITLLVGENSTGKTTFLGCYQRFVDMLHLPSAFVPDGEFSRPPFSMGGFSDIVRRVGNGKRKIHEFQVGGNIVRARAMPSPLSLMYSFGEKDDHVSVVQLTLQFPDNDELVAHNASSVWQDVTGNLDAIMLNLSGPGFGCPVLGIDMTGGNGLTYRSIFSVIAIDALQEMLTDEKTRAILKREFPSLFQGNVANNKKKMLAFLQRKFDFRDKDVRKPLLLHSNAVINLGECIAVSPIRPMPHRSYESVLNGNEEERFLVEMSRMSRVNPKKWGKLRGGLVEFGAKSGMFSRLEVLSRGKGADAPFSIRVNARGADANIADVGYGVSQLLPFLGRVVKASLEEQPKHFLFQQPEDHLHPRAQAEFASFITESAKKNGHTFLVETHSDFIVDRVRICVAKGLIDPEDVALLYFEPQKSGGKVKIHRIEMNNNGEPAHTPPKGYREFFLHETERVLGLRKD